MCVIVLKIAVTDIDLFRERLEQVVELAGGPSKLSTAAGISRRVLDQYRSGRSDPSRSKLVSIANAAGVSTGWLADGRGPIKLDEPSIAGSEVKLERIRKFVWNIADTFWQKAPRRTKSNIFADQFLEMFDYLVSREDVNEDAASEVIQFSAERLKHASGSDGK